MTGETQCGLYPQGTRTQIFKGRGFWHMLQYGWTLRGCLSLANSLARSGVTQVLHFHPLLWCPYGRRHFPEWAHLLLKLPSDWIWFSHCLGDLCLLCALPQAHSLPATHGHHQPDQCTAFLGGTSESLTPLVLVQMYIWQEGTTLIFILIVSYEMKKHYT